MKIRDIKNLLIYRKTILANIGLVNKIMQDNSTEKIYKFKAIGLDSAYRMYTVLNFDDIDPETYDKYEMKFGMDEQAKDFISSMDRVLGRLGLGEMVALSRAEILTPKSILIVMEYKFISVPKLYRRVIFGVILSIITSLLIITNL